MGMEKELFQITEAARACGLSRSTLLRMEEKGLIRHEAGSKARVYHPALSRDETALAEAEIAFEDLDECMYEILKDTLEYLEENPKEIDSTTRDAYVYYKDLHDRKMQDAANRQED